MFQVLSQNFLIDLNSLTTIYNNNNRHDVTSAIEIVWPFIRISEVGVVFFVRHYSVRFMKEKIYIELNMRRKYL